MRKKTNEEFLQQLKAVNSNINPLEEYKGAETPINCECLICHTVWKARPNNIFSKGYGCPKCGQKKASKSNIIPKEEFLKRFNNDEIELIGDWSIDNIAQAINNVKEKTGFKGKMLYMPIRIKTTGFMHGPELAKTIYLFGYEKIINRLGK